MDKQKNEKIKKNLKEFQEMGFGSEQMYEIFIGLESGIDVAEYADPKFNYDQMREIRHGLEEGLDVSKYANPKFD